MSDLERIKELVQKSKGHEILALELEDRSEIITRLIDSHETLRTTLSILLTGLSRADADLERLFKHLKSNMRYKHET